MWGTQLAGREAKRCARARRLLLVALAALVAGAVAATPAGAVLRVASSGSTITVVADPGVANTVSVIYLPSYDAYRFKDDFSGELSAVDPKDSRCSIPLQPTVSCTPTAGITRIEIMLGDGNDRTAVARIPRLDYAPIPASVSFNVDLGSGNDEAELGLGNDQIFGGPGADLLYGYEGNDLVAGLGGRDWVEGGTGVDAMFGNAGNDKLKARDGTRDARIACGPGRRDRVRVDRRSPADPAASGCELGL